MEKVINYSKENLKITWKPDLCTHSANCVKGLHQVFNTTNKPWINLDMAKQDEIIEQVKKCPSGALGFELL